MVKFKNINSWSEFESILSGLSKKEKGDAFEELTLHYLSIHPTYATQLTNIWQRQKVPQNIRKKLNFPDNDEGIDLVAKTRDGNFWAIQCKYHADDNHSLTRRELATFTDLTFGICKGFELALVCTSTDRFSHKLEMYGERISFIAGDVWRGLDVDFFNLLHRNLSNRPVALKPCNPRPHQEEAIKEAISYYIKGENERGKLIMPCGSGKSLTAFWMAEKFKAKLILIAVPSLALVKQTFEVWARESIANKHNIRWIAVCSDASVAHNEHDDVSVLVQDLGIRVHTNPQEIASWLKRSFGGISVVVTTYQSGRSVADASRIASVSFDLGILDEAHKTVGKRGSLFDHLLHDENIDIHNRIFMTATERRYRGESDDVLSMDDPTVFGETFYLLSFKEALEFEPPILSDYKIVTVAVTHYEIEQMLKLNLIVKPDKGEWDEELEAEMLAALVALRKAMCMFSIRHAVSFHSRISRAKAFRDSHDRFTKIFPEYGPLNTFHITGRTATAVRKSEINAFAKAERSLITNARCLSEGVDVPGIDCILFADPKRSIIDIVQALGRALRPVPGKKFGYVIIPVVIENTGKPEITRFDNVLMVLRALATNDERIIEYFRSISQGEHPSVSIPVEFTVPDGITVSTDEFINSIELKAWSRLAKLSWRPFIDARTFVRGLHLKSEYEWRSFCMGKQPEKGRLPYDIPPSPHYIYKDKGWCGMGDWLGTGAIATRSRVYRPFKEARAFTRHLNLKNSDEWKLFCKGDLPEKGKLPNDIPAFPNRTYKDMGWHSMGDWLGTGTVANYLKVYRTFEEARAFAQGLKLKNWKEWRSFCKGKLPEKGVLPKDVPASPHKTYKNNGWQNSGDWLGTCILATYHKVYRPFHEAREFARSLKLKNKREWKEFCRGQLSEKGILPEDIPISPNKTYKDEGWIGMGDWLGTGTIANFFKVYRPFEEARDFARSIKLKGGEEWIKFCKGQLPEKGTLPDDIPHCPNQTYKEDGWLSMGDWLGTGTVANYLKVYKPFEEAREFARRLELKCSADWRIFCKGKLPGKGKLPDDIPANPDKTYKDKGWQSYGDWLGTGTIAPNLKIYRTFEEARNYARNLKLRKEYEWREFCKGKLPEKGTLPDDIPSNPNVTYKGKGWKGIGDWLGTGKIASRFRVYRSFEEARIFARSLKLKNGVEWGAFSRGLVPEKGTLPDDIPANPSGVYKDQGWKGMGDWLGTGTIASRSRVFRPFEEARKFIWSLDLKRENEWRLFRKGKLPEKGTLPDDIPTNPNVIYKDLGWKGMGDWLGTGTIAPRLRVYRPFEEAREFTQGLKLKNGYEWQRYCKGQLSGKGALPDDIPKFPNRTYKDKGWHSMGDWLGTGTIANSLKAYRSFEDARAFARSLNLIGWKEWKEFCKGKLPNKGSLPKDIPTSPSKAYKDKGWRGISDWLGTVAVASKRKKFWPFKEAREYVRGLKLKSIKEWQAYCTGRLMLLDGLPDYIPTHPDQTYKDEGWKSYGDWLGTYIIAASRRNFKTFIEAREFARSLKLKSSDEWKRYCKGQLPGKETLPDDIPTNPNRTYKDQGWKGMGDWLGTGTVASKLKIFKPYKEAREYVRSLKLKNRYDWNMFCKGQLPEKGCLPGDIPMNPNRTYKGKGWKGIRDWLGTENDIQEQKSK